MRRDWALIVALGVGLSLGLGSGFAIAQRNEVVSKAEFVAGADCRLNFTITYHHKSITGAIAWTEEGPVLWMPAETLVLIDGKITDDAGAMFGAIILHKKVAVGLYDGAILPIDLLGLNLRSVADCVWKRFHPDLPVQ